MKIPEPSGQMKVVFLLSILLMAIHKIESFLSNEWEFSPAYKYFLSLNLSRGELLFLAFIVTLIVGLVWVWIILSFRTGKWIFLCVWGLTFLLEWHHLFRPMYSGHYYSGMISAIVYVLFGIFYWSVLLRHFTNKKNFFHV